MSAAFGLCCLLAQELLSCSWHSWFSPPPDTDNLYFRLIWTGILGEKAQPTYSAPCCALELPLFEMGGLFGGYPQSHDNAFAPCVISRCKMSSMHSKCLTSLAAMRGPQTIAELGCAPRIRADRWSGHSTIFQEQGHVDF